MKLSFRYRFILSFVLLEALFLSMIVLVNFTSIEHTAKKLIDLQTNSMKTLSSQLLSTPVSVYDLATIDNVLEDLTAMKGVRAAEVRDTRERILSARGGKPEDALVEKVQSPIVSQEIMLGTLTLWLDFSDNYTDIAANRVKTLEIIALELMISILLSWIIGHRLSHNLERLTESAHQIGKSEYVEIPTIKSGDEVEKLAGAMSLMQQRIKERSKELESLNATLEVRVREEVEKNSMQERLLMQQSRLAAMGEMIGAIAHQWRQPLNALGLVLQHIGRLFEYGLLDQAKVKQSISKGTMLVDQMSGTIDDFRHFFQTNKTKQRFSPAAEVQKSVSLLEGTLKNFEIGLRFEHMDESELEGYPGEFGQCVLNLLTNAKDALLEQNPETKWIEISVNRQEECLMISVKDNAGGISKEVMEKVFNPYFTTKEEGKGTGIGLYMTKTIIEEHMGGTVRVHNTQEGAEFVMELPIKENSECQQFSDEKIIPKTEEM